MIACHVESMPLAASGMDCLHARHLGTRTAESCRRLSAANRSPPSTPGLSFLESSSVRTAPLKNYFLRMQGFVEWCAKQGADWQTDLPPDHSLVVCFDELSFRRHPVADGTKALAAIKYYVPQVSRTGPGSLPRALRAVASRTKAAPPRQRLPLPHPAECGGLPGMTDLFDKAVLFDTKPRL